MGVVVHTYMHQSETVLAYYVSDTIDVIYRYFMSALMCVCDYITSIQTIDIYPKRRNDWYLN